jgi:flagellar biosynthesis/type III secretory pathway protein FliH
MNIHDATETAYQNGYQKGRADAAKEIFEEIKRSLNDLEYNAKTPRKTVRVEELKAHVNWVLHEVVPSTLDRLANKYTEDKNE